MSIRGYFSKNIGYTILFSFVLVGVTLAAYMYTFRVGFIWDDFLTIYQHLPAKGELDFFKGFKSTHYFRPTQTLFYMVDFLLWHHNPLGYHLTNFLFHLLNSLLVVLLVWLATDGDLSKKNNDSHGRFFISWTAGLFFALHPIHTESVNWISARTDLICTAFFLLSLICYMEFRKQSRFIALIPCVIFGFFAIGSKETAVVLPLIFIAFEVFYSRNWKISMFLLGTCLLFQIIVFWIRFPAIYSVIKPYLNGEYSAVQFLKTAITAYGFYVFKFIWPTNLSLFIGKLPEGWFFVLSSAAAVVLLLLITFVFRNKKSFIPFFSIWILVTILPHEIILLGGSAVAPVAERYVYLPSIGECVLLSALLYYFYSNWSKALAICVVTIILSFYFVVTFTRTQVWADSELLWEDTVRKSPEFGLPYQWYGNALYKKEKILEAISVWKQGLKCPYMTGKGMDITGVDAKFRKALFHTSIALAQMKLKDYKKAHAHLIKALKLYPNHYKIYFLLGMIEREKSKYSDGARKYLALRKAMELFKISIKLNSNYQDALYYMALTSYDLGNMKVASEFFEKALKLDPRTNMAINSALFLFKINGRFPDFK